MNLTVISGFVGTVSDVKKVGEKNEVLNFSVAVNKSYIDKEGKKVEQTLWVEASLWNRAKVYEYIKKGTHVVLQGEIGVKAYLNKENVPTATMTLEVDKIEFNNVNKAEEAKA